MYRPSRFSATVVLVFQLLSLDLYATGGRATAQRARQQASEQQQQSSWFPKLRPWQWGVMILGGLTIALSGMANTGNPASTLTSSWGSDYPLDSGYDFQMDGFDFAEFNPR